MTDITKLVKRLRIGGLVSETQVEAADALEAQVRETAQLEETSLENHAVAQILLVDYRARIAELEAALKPFEQKSSKSLADAEKLAANEGYELPDDQTAEDIYAWALALTWGDLRAARAARNGEKVNAKGGP